MAQERHAVLNAQLLADDAGYRSAGISHYIFNLLAALPEASGGFRYTVLAGPKRPVLPDALPVVGTRWPTHRPPVRILWEQAVQPLLLRRLKPDIYHGLGFTLPLVGPWKSVVTVYDLSFLRFPQAFRPWKRLYLSIFARAGARKADRVIAISEHTKRDVERFWHVSEDRISVAYGGVSPRFKPLPKEEVERFRRQRGFPAQFLLYLGTLEPRKNLSRLVDAYAGAWKRDSSLPPLMIAGARGWYYGDIFARVQALDLEDRIFFPGFVPEDELALWYNAAEMFVYPSLYEGFGLPVLEAMACGRPVITSNAASLPEVVGDAGITVPPDDTDALSDAILALWHDPERRKALGERALRRAEKFSWTETARSTVNAYKAVLRES